MSTGKTPEIEEEITNLVEEVMTATEIVKNEQEEGELKFGELEVMQRLHISMDKPIYMPNDVIFVEVLVMDALRKIPGAERKRDGEDLESDEWYLKEFDKVRPMSMKMIISDSNGNEVFKTEEKKGVRGEDSSFVFTYKIPADQAGGIYSAKFMLSEGESNASFVEERMFRIERYTPE